MRGPIAATAAYAFMLWQIAFGGFLLHVTQPVRMLLRHPPKTAQ